MTHTHCDTHTHTGWLNRCGSSSRCVMFVSPSQRHQAADKASGCLSDGSTLRLLPALLLHSRFLSSPSLPFVCFFFFFTFFWFRFLSSVFFLLLCFLSVSLLYSTLPLFSSLPAFITSPFIFLNSPRFFSCSLSSHRFVSVILLDCFSHFSFPLSLLFFLSSPSLICYLS